VQLLLAQAKQEQDCDFAVWGGWGWVKFGVTITKAGGAINAKCKPPA